MTLNRVKLGRAVPFMKYLASVVSLIFLAKTLISNKITFPAPNLQNFANSSDDKILSSLIEKAWCTCTFLNHFREANEQLLCALFL